MKSNSWKSKVMAVGRSELETGEVIVEEVEEFKYSGMWVDSKLCSNVQIAEEYWTGDMGEQSEWPC